MVLRAAKNPTWLHKIITHATEYQNLANSCINSAVPAGTPSVAKAVNSKPVPATGPPAQKLAEKQTCPISGIPSFVISCKIANLSQ